MLKQVVDYTDYNNNPQQEVLYFNLDRHEVMDLFDLKPKLEKWVTASTNPEKVDFTVDDVREFLDIIKLLIEKSYGERSSDGKYFTKDPAVFNQFRHSAMYDAFLFSLFEDLEKAARFMAGILPAGLVSQAEVERAIEGAQSGTPTPLSVVSEPDIPAERKFEHYTREELLDLPQEEFVKLVPSHPKDMTHDQLVLAMERKQRKDDNQHVDGSDNA